MFENCMRNEGSQTWEVHSFLSIGVRLRGDEKPWEPDASGAELGPDPLRWKETKDTGRSLLDQVS